MRAFIAIELPKKVCSELQKIPSLLDSQSSAFRWGKADQRHLTLRFLGEVEESLAPSIQRNLMLSLSRFSSFDLQLGKLGGFPKLEKCRILWQGIDRGFESCEQLKKLVDDALSASAITPDPSEQFIPHITIGRSKMGKIVRLPKPTLLRLTAYSSELNVPVASISLFKSDLTPSGPIHTRLAQIPLRG